MELVRDIDPVFVGRAASLADLGRLVDSGASLVTVLGGPGLGKSRLALRFAAEHARGFEATAFVDAAGVTEADDLLARTALAIGAEIREPGQPGIDALAQVLKDRGRFLLVLDGLEGVAAHAIDLVQSCLHRARDLVVLATSQVALDSSAEIRFELEPLDRDESRALFVARAAQRKRGFALDPTHQEALDELTESLDHIPLAIELAAARVPTMSIPELRERIRRDLAILGPNRRDAPARHATMTSAIDWSWQMLSPELQQTLAELSVFAGAFTVEAAETVLGEDAADSALEHLQILRERSLLRSLPAGGRQCMRLFDSVRAFACARLSEREAGPRARHARFFASRYLATADLMYGVPKDVTLDDLAREQEDLLAALEFGLEEDLVSAARCAIVLVRFISVRGPGWRGWEILERATAVIGQLGSEPELVARILMARAIFARSWFGRLDLTDDLEQSLRRLQALPLRALESEARGHLGVILLESNQPERGGAEITEALEMAEADGHPVAVCLCRGARGIQHFGAGNLQACVRALDGAIASRGAAVSERMRARYLALRGRARYELGELEAARADLVEARGLQQDVDDRLYLPVSLLHLAELELALGEVGSARGLVADAAGRVRAVGVHRLGASPTVLQAWIDLAEGHLDLARDRFQGAIESTELRPSLSAAALGVGLCSLLQGDLEDARERLSWAISQPSERGLGIVATGLAYLALTEHRAEAGAKTVGDLLGRATEAAEKSGSRRVRDIVAWTHATVHGIQPSATSPEWPELRALAGRPGSRPSVGSTYDASSMVLTTAEGQRIELASRPLLARLVDQLALARADRPGVSIPKDELIERLWPEDRGRDDAKTNRLWVAVSTLRKMGLRSLLIRTEEGYLFDPDKPFTRVN